MEAPSGQIRVLLADDHALFREGLAGLLAASGECTVAGVAANGAELTGMLSAGVEADVALVDIDMPVMDGFAVAEMMAARYPEVGVIVLSMHGQEEYYFRMLDLGVKGFMLKNSEIGEVLAAIRAVMRGGTYFSQELLTMLVEGMHAPAPGIPSETLSERETEILGLICHGLSNGEIADRLFISKRTVDKHRANILEKTGTRNTAALVVYALKNSLVEI